MAPATVALAGPAAEGTDGFSLHGNLRLRYETIANQARAGAAEDDTLFQTRAQIVAQYRQDDWRLVAEVHDSRAWHAKAATPLSTGEVNTLEPVQAYIGADLGAVLGKGSALSAQAGRFTLNLGSRHLIASDDYRNTTNAYTGLKFDISLPKGVNATAIYVLPVSRLPDDAAALRDNKARLDHEGFDAVLWGGLVSRKSGRRLIEASFYHFGEHDTRRRATRDRSLHSLGLRLHAEPAPGAFDYGAEGIYQWGRTNASSAANAARLPVRASYLRAYAGYSFAAPWKPRLSLDFDRASGDGAGRAYTRFDPLFSTRRPDLAPSALYSALARANLLSPGARLEVTPSKRLDGMVAYRALWLANRRDAFSGTGVRDAAGTAGRFAGHQLDVRVRYWLVPQRLRAEFDGVLLAKGRFLHAAPNAPASGDTRYATVNLTANF